MLESAWEEVQYVKGLVRESLELEAEILVKKEKILLEYNGLSKGCILGHPSGTQIRVEGMNKSGFLYGVIIRKDGGDAGKIRYLPEKKEDGVTLIPSWSRLEEVVLE